MIDDLKTNLVFKLKVEPIGYDYNRPVGATNPCYGIKFTVSDKFELNYIVSNLELAQAHSVDLEGHIKQDLKRKIFEKLFAPIIYPIISDLRYLLDQPEIRHSDIYDLYRKIDSLQYDYIELDGG